MRKDIDLSFRKNPLTGDLATVTKSNAINQAMKNLLLTEYYKRGFNIEVGCNLNALVFSLYSPLQQQTIRDLIKRSLDNFEPSEVVSIDVNFEEGSNSLEITIAYYENNNNIVQQARFQYKY